MPAKESVSGPIILHLDSLGMHSSTKILNTVERYLEEEWRHLKKSPSPDTSVSEIIWEDLPSNIHKEKVQVPQQNNAYDCGIFMLYYIEQFIREAPERFTIDNLGMFDCSWFKPEDASGLRLRIRELLEEAFESARLDDAMSEAAASDGSYIGDGIKGELEAYAPSAGSEMVLEFGNTGKRKKASRLQPLESGESYNSGKYNEGIKVAESEEASGETGDAGRSIEGYVADSEEEIGESGEAGKSVEGINVAEPEEASGESGDAGRSIEVINVAESDDASEEFGYAGKTKKSIKVATSEGASMDCVSTDKSMVSVSDKAPASKSKCVENTACCALSEAASFSDSMKDEGTMKADSGSSKTEKEGLIAIVSAERLRNEGAIPRTPIPDVVCDSNDSDMEIRVEIVRIYRKSPQKVYIPLT